MASKCAERNVQELLPPPRLGAITSNAPCKLSAELHYAYCDFLFFFLLTHKSALHVWECLLSYLQICTSVLNPLGFTLWHTLTHLHMCTQNVPPALCTDRSENERTPKEHTGNRGDEFRVEDHRARLMDILSRGLIGERLSFKTYFWLFPNVFPLGRFGGWQRLQLRQSLQGFYWCSAGSRKGTATQPWPFCLKLLLVLNYQSSRITQAVNLSTS